MNCLWKVIPDSDDSQGWRKTVCVRCGHKTAPWPREHTHYKDCTGTPFWWEFGNWIEILLQIARITKPRWATLTGGDPNCRNCDQRQEALNTFGARFLKFTSYFRRTRSTIKDDD